MSSENRNKRTTRPAQNLLNGEVGSGPYVATVVNHLDQTFMGSLEVQLDKLNTTGNSVDEATQTVIVQYASPFYGVTARQHTSGDNTYSGSQQSYGFWAVPPDIGTKVLVMFVEGDIQQGYWFACIPDPFMNFMVPDGRPATALNTQSVDNTSAPLPGVSTNSPIPEPSSQPAIGYGEGEIDPALARAAGITPGSAAQSDPIVGGRGNIVEQPGERQSYEFYSGGLLRLPVGEYNKNTTQPNGETQPSRYTKPVNIDFVERLAEQGLLEDDFRGLTSSSARREIPSAVFGMSTPGPLDKRSGAPRGEKGTLENRTQDYVSRLGGHSIVMDDGDDKLLRVGPASSSPAEYIDVLNGGSGGDVAWPANDLFRIRTRTGHQILLHNTEDLIYISNSRGTAWVELTSNGKIDIYAQDSISVHSEQDLNFTADRDINFTAGQTVNMVAGEDFKTNIGGAFSVTSGSDMSMSSGGGVSVSAGQQLALFAKSNASLVSEAGVLTVNGGGELAVVSSSDVSFTSGGSFRVACQDDAHINANDSVYVTSASGSMNLKSSADFYMESSSGSMHSRAGVAQFIESKASFNLRSGVNLYIEAVGGNMDMKASSAMRQESGDDMSMNSGGTIILDGSPNVRINEGTKVAATPASPAAGTISAGLPGVSTPTLPVQPSAAAIASRIPQHEPWLQHENLNPEMFTPSMTKAGTQSSDVYKIPLPDTFLNIGRNRSTNNTTFSTPSYPSYGVTDMYDGYVVENTEELGLKNLGNDNSKLVYEYFINKGLPKSQAAAIVGNLMVESTERIDHTVVGDAGRAYGIAQWNDTYPDRVTNFKDVIGVDLRSSSFQQQLDFIWWEMSGEPTTNTTYRRDYGAKEVYEFMMSVQEPDSSSVDVLLDNARLGARKFDARYERSNAMHRERRATLAAEFLRQALDNFSAEINPGSAGPTDAPSNSQLVDPGTGSLTMRVVEAQGGATRRLPIQQGLKSILNKAAHAAHIDKVVVYSGGQLPYPGSPRVGSTRHDNGRAADFYLVVNGRTLNGTNQNDRVLMENFITAAVKYGIRAVGWAVQYMGPNNIHMDILGANGNLIVWGQGGKSANKVAWVDAAARRGIS